MKATGIVRRIDDLGRVVIPKEIRRTMRIREGDPLEIYTDNDGEVIFKKYSPIGELSNYVNVFAEIINKATGNTVAVVDKDVCIAVSGAYKKELIDHKISPEVGHILEQRQQYVYKIGDKRISVIDTSSSGVATEKCYAGIISPIIVDGDVIGAIILLINDLGTAPSDIDIKVLNTSTQLLARQLEA
jgi:AbrB family transcriptional regulator (stage V sporulation protein T)